MTAPTSPQPAVVRLHTRRSRRGRWKLVGVYPSADAAWAALRALPAGVQVWFNDRIPPAEEAAEPADHSAVTPRHPPRIG